MAAPWTRRLRRPPDDHLIHLSEFFVIVLIGVAYEATIEAVGKVLREHGDTWGTGLLLATFVLTTFRFLVGNYRHLNRQAMRSSPRFVLLYDMFFIGIESMAMIFLGTFVSVEHNELALRNGSDFNYLTLLIVLSGLDMTWLVSRLLLALFHDDKGNRIGSRTIGFPVNWAVINALVIIGGCLLWWGTDHAALTGKGFLAGVLVVNLAIFFFDVLGILDTTPEESHPPACRFKLEELVSAIRTDASISSASRP
jgi:hypothetical protein